MAAQNLQSVPDQPAAPQEATQNQDQLEADGQA